MGVVVALDFTRSPAYIPAMRVTVNGVMREVFPRGLESLAFLLRERLNLRGTKVACERGECGTCTVLRDGRTVYSCLVPAAACEGVSITTIEGVATRRPDGSLDLHPVQRAFVDCDAVQCGYCTPAQVLAAAALLDGDPDPSAESMNRAMAGTLCRCGTYPRIAQAIRLAASRTRTPAGGGA